jgi:hypothetical protein
MAEKGLTAYLWVGLRSCGNEEWRVMRQYIIPAVVTVGLAIIVILVGAYFTPDTSRWSKIEEILRSNWGVILGLISLGFVYAFFNTMSRIYWDQKDKISNLGSQIAEKQHVIDASAESEPVFDMPGEEVVDYMFRNTEYGTTDEIGNILTIAASQKKIHVMATRIDDGQLFPVNSTIFDNNSFWLLSQNTNNEGIVFNVQRQYDESGHYEAYPPGGCIWGRLDHNSIFERPMFCRAQIEKCWKPKKVT